jgi:cell division protein FtsQ
MMNTTKETKLSPGMRLGLLCLALVLGGVSLPLLARFFTEGSAFQIQSVIVSHTSRIKPEEIQTYLREYIGRPLYGVDLEEVQEKTHRHPWVKSAIVRRSPPHELHVDIRERTPTALIAFDKLYIVDDEGELFKPSNRNDGVTLPVISGVSKKQWDSNSNAVRKQINIAVAALREHALAQKPGGEISEIHLSARGQITAYFVNGLEVALGKDDYEQKWNKLAQILKLLRDKKHELAYAYLDDYPNSNQVAVRFRNRGINRGTT